LSRQIRDLEDDIGTQLPKSELLKEIGGDVPEERKREMKALFDSQSALKEHLAFLSDV
jgi:hypothetical protein